MTSKWNKESDCDHKIVWRNNKNPSITVEAHREGDREDDYYWYAYIGYAFIPKRGRGTASSPYIEDSKKEIISIVAQLKIEVEESY